MPAGRMRRHSHGLAVTSPGGHTARQNGQQGADGPDLLPRGSVDTPVSRRDKHSCLCLACPSALSDTRPQATSHLAGEQPSARWVSSLHMGPWLLPLKDGASNASACHSHARSVSTDDRKARAPAYSAHAR